MKIYTNSHSAFPDQVVPAAEKATWEYGLRVGRAIEGEWFWAGRGRDRFHQNFQNFHSLRLYARGEQSIQKYKDELAIDGDLSYLNLDWKPVPVLAKFVDIVVNGITERTFDINAYAQDPTCSRQRTEYAQGLMTDINAKEFFTELENTLGVDAWNSPDRTNAPQNTEELAIHMQMDFKQAVEVAEEEVINQVLDKNKFDLTRTRMIKDLVEIGIGSVKTNWNEAEGVIVDYVDPATLVWSYTEDPNFEDIWYAGEVKGISLSELKKEFPALTAAELEEIQKYPGNQNYLRNWNGRLDDNTIQVLYFEYKTFTNQVFKLKENSFGLEKVLEKQDTYNPPENELGYGKLERSIEVLYSGAKILGHPQMLKWELAKNMTRPLANTCKVNMNYGICAPRIYKGRINSLVNRVTGFADMIQLTHLKLQQVLSRMVPDGVYLDVDGLAEVDLGNGTNYNPREALNMYFQTGSVVGRSLTQDGDPNRGKVPIQELNSSSGMSKIQSLITTYNYYLQMIRDVTGLNEARDASVPDKDSLVGLQKLAAANSNTATRHILQASLYLTHRICENISMRIADSLEYPTTRDALANSISPYNVGTLDELADLNIHDFGIFINLEPDEEEKAELEQNIQIALKENQIYLEDAIDIREVKNLTLANQCLKFKRKKKAEQDQKMQQQMMEQQAALQQQTAQQAATFEVQKKQSEAETTGQLEQLRNQLELQKMQAKLQLDIELSQVQHKQQMELEMMRSRGTNEKEKEIEDRKDKRIRIQGTQQSQMIAQRTEDSAPSDFEKGDGQGQLPLGMGDFTST